MDTNKPVAALFDFDGVVMDTETQYSKFWAYQGRKYHPEISDFDQLIKGSTLDQIFEKHFEGMKDIREQIRRELDRFEAEMDYKYIPGVQEFMNNLRDNNVKIAIVTSSNEKKMANVYRIHPELQDQVDRILTADCFAKSKPDPECFLLGAKIFETTSENSFVFEDSFNGLMAGNRAGMHVIGLSTTNPYESIKDKAHLVIENFEDFNYQRMIELAE